MLLVTKYKLNIPYPFLEKVDFSKSKKCMLYTRPSVFISNLVESLKAGSLAFCSSALYLDTASMDAKFTCVAGLHGKLPA